MAFSYAICVSDLVVFFGGLAPFCVFVHNEEWQSGRSGSLTEAFMVCRVYGVVFFLLTLCVLFWLYICRSGLCLVLSCACIMNFQISLFFYHSAGWALRAASGPALRFAAATVVGAMWSRSERHGIVSTWDYGRCSCREGHRHGFV